MAKRDDLVRCLRRSEGFLRRAVQSGDFLQLQCDSIEHLYKDLAEAASERINSISTELVLDKLGDQSKIFPAFLGHGIAIPHIYSKDIDQRVCFVAHLEQGIEIPGQDEAIEFVFFLISPEGDSEGHLATLADIARNCRAERSRERIKSATTIDEVLGALNN